MDLRLVPRFAEADLRLKMLDGPVFGAGREIFQMDIRRDRTGESFRLWTGGLGTSVDVLNLDRRLRQLVLRVKEPRRRFEERLWTHRVTREEADQRARDTGGTLVGTQGGDWIIERWTSTDDRRYLCGRDESHLFIAQVERATTVRAAHASLKPQEVRDADRSAPERTLRQGEWFFVELSASELKALAEHLRRRGSELLRRESLGGNGRPHMADEVVRLGGRVYARGAVRHPDHKTLVLGGWRRVHRNAEVRQSAVGSNGVYWID